MRPKKGTNVEKSCDVSMLVMYLLQVRLATFTGLFLGKRIGKVFLYGILLIAHY